MAIRYNAKEASEEGFDRVPPGRYHCQVEAAEEKRTGDGDPMISLRWRRLGDSFTLCFDNLVFSAKGRGIAHKKLKILGARGVSDSAEDVEIEASDLIGCEAYLTVRDKIYKDKKYLEPDFDAAGFGYEPVDNVPLGKAPAGAPSGGMTDKELDDNCPF